MDYLQNIKHKLIALIKSNFICLQLISFINNNSLYKGVLVLGTGTAFAQIIGILSMPLITRLYSPSDLGILTIYSSVLSLVVVTASFRYEIACPLPQKKEEVTNLIALCFILIFGTSLMFTLILILLGDPIITIFSLEPLAPFVWLLVIGFFGMGLYNTLNYWAIRERKYEKITKTKINQSISGTLIKIILGFLSFGPLGLIFGYIVSQIAGISTFVMSMWKTERNNIGYISLNCIISVAKRYWRFPTFNLASSFLNTLSFQLPPLVLLFLYDSKIVGFYALANMLIVLPGSVIKNSVGQAFFGDASKIFREGSFELRSLYIKTAKHLTILALPLIGIPAILFPFVVPFIFGEEWVEAGWYILPLALMVIPTFIISPITRLDMLGYNNWLVIWDLSRVLGVVGGFYLSYLLDLGIMITLTIYSTILLFMYIILMAMNLKAIDNHNANLSH